MTRKTKDGPVTFNGPGSTPKAQARAIEKLRDWTHRMSDGIERGELPARSGERFTVAWILRRWADQLQPAKPSRRGNPNFLRKLPDDDRPAFLVALRIAEGIDEPEAIRQVAELWEVDESTLAKLFRARRKAIADSPLILAHRAGSIRGE